MREKEKGEVSQKCIAQTKMEIGQSVSQSDSDRKASLQSPLREREARVCHSTPADGPVGMLD